MVLRLWDLKTDKARNASCFTASATSLATLASRSMLMMNSNSWILVGCEKTEIWVVAKGLYGGLYHVGDAVVDHKSTKDWIIWVKLPSESLLNKLGVQWTTLENRTRTQKTEIQADNNFRLYQILLCLLSKHSEYRRKKLLNINRRWRHLSVTQRSKLQVAATVASVRLCALCVLGRTGDTRRV